MIITDDKMSSLKLSRGTQIVASFGIALFLCFAAFFAGKYISPSNKYKIVASKEAFPEQTLDVQSRVEVLENDILMLEEYLKALHKYDNFIIYNNSRFLEYKVPENFGGDKVSELETRRNELLASLQVRALNRINSIETVLKSVGLNYARLTGRNTPREAMGGPFIPVKLEDIQKNRQMYTNGEFFSQLKYLYELERIMSAMPLAYPIGNARITSGFGVRNDPFSRSYSMHYGIDFAGKENSKAFATAPGVVTRSEWMSGYGNLVEINHGFGLVTRYGHLKEWLVEKGQKVKRGDAIGIQGSTGRSTGDHLHYEVRINGLAVNPIKFVNKARMILYYDAEKKS